MLVLTLLVLIRVGCALAGVAGGGAVAGGCGGCLHAGQAVQDGGGRVEQTGDEQSIPVHHPLR